MRSTVGSLGRFRLMRSDDNRVCGLTRSGRRCVLDDFTADTDPARMPDLRVIDLLFYMLRRVAEGQGAA
jgi:hypothetical protein